MSECEQSWPLKSWQHSAGDFPQQVTGVADLDDILAACWFAENDGKSAARRPNPVVRMNNTFTLSPWWWTHYSSIVICTYWHPGGNHKGTWGTTLPPFTNVNMFSIYHVHFCKRWGNIADLQIWQVTPCWYRMHQKHAYLLRVVLVFTAMWKKNRCFIVFSTRSSFG